MKKPSVFLSHSKKDKDIIERVANDLRRARINVWYDEWEIPTGESFTKKIFEEGIPNCDLFFIYLTKESIDSYWVQRELDAAFIKDIEVKGGFFALFVDSEETRKSMRIDLRAINSPILRADEYYNGLINLISRIWEATIKRTIEETKESYQLDKLKLQNEILVLENKILNISKSNLLEDSNKIIDNFKKIFYEVEDVKLSYYEIFFKLSSDIAAGITLYWFADKLFRKCAGLDLESYIKYELESAEIIGRFIIEGLVILKPAGDQFGECYYLTEKGREVAKILFI